LNTVKAFKESFKNYPVGTLPVVCSYSLEVIRNSLRVFIFNVESCLTAVPSFHSRYMSSSYQITKASIPTDHNEIDILNVVHEPKCIGDAMRRDRKNRQIPKQIRISRAELCRGKNIRGSDGAYLFSIKHKPPEVKSADYVPNRFLMRLIVENPKYHHLFEHYFIGSINNAKRLLGIPMDLAIDRPRQSKKIKVPPDPNRMQYRILFRLYWAENSHKADILTDLIVDLNQVENLINSSFVRRNFPNRSKDDSSDSEKSHLVDFTLGVGTFKVDQSFRIIKDLKCDVVRPIIFTDLVIRSKI